MTVRKLLMLGVSPDSTNEDGLTALHQVSLFTRIYFCKYEIIFSLHFIKKSALIFYYFSRFFLLNYSSPDTCVYISFNKIFNTYQKFYLLIL